MTTTTFYAVKGGSGATTVAVMAAVAASANGPTLLVDAGGGDCAPVLRAEAWSDYPYPVLGPDLGVLTVVASPEGLASRLRRTTDFDTIIVDAGTTLDPGTAPEFGRLVMVTRPDLLALLRSARASTRPDAIVLVDEPGRALTASEVGEAIGAPVIATIDTDPEIARWMDARLMSRRVPRSAARAIAAVIA